MVNMVCSPISRLPTDTACHWILKIFWPISSPLEDIYRKTVHFGPVFPFRLCAHEYLLISPRRMVFPGLAGRTINKYTPTIPEVKITFLTGEMCSKIF